MSPGTDASQAASQEAERLRRDAESKKKEAEILQRARSESAAELARLKTELSVSKRTTRRARRPSSASNAAVDERSDCGDGRDGQGRAGDDGRLWTSSQKPRRSSAHNSRRSKQELGQAQTRLKASQHNSDATQAEAERAIGREALRTAKASNEKLTKRLGALEAERRLHQ